MKRLKSKRTPVWICAVNGAVLDLSALSYGPLAVTRALARFKSGLDDSYAVTHVSTGLALLNDVPLALAKTACIALMESGILWRKVRSKNYQRYAKRVKAALKAVNVDMAT